jgi:hypothetical protein
MAPVLAITDMGGESPSRRQPLIDPRWRDSSTLSSPGRTGSHFPTKESRNESSRAVAYSQREEGMGTTVTVQ